MLSHQNWKPNKEQTEGNKWIKFWTNITEDVNSKFKILPYALSKIKSNLLSHTIEGRFVKKFALTVQKRRMGTCQSIYSVP